MKPFLENLVLLMQSLYYLTAIAVLIFLAILFWQTMQAQNRYHNREDAKLEESLRRNELLLNDHVQQMQRLAR